MCERRTARHSHHAHALPAVAIGVRVGTRHNEAIFENELRSYNINTNEKMI
jgi:hypothetical protein